MIDHLRQLESVTGKTPNDLAKRGRVPAGAEYLWGHFWALCAARGSNGFGPNAISYSEIDAFLRLNRLELEPWEIDALKAMDTAWLRVVTEKEA